MWGYLMQTNWWELKVLLQATSSTIRGWPARSWSVFMCLGMTNKECKALTLILHNRWYQQPSLRFAKDIRKNGLHSMHAVPYVRNI